MIEDLTTATPYSRVYESIGVIIRQDKIASVDKALQALIDFCSHWPALFL